MATSANLEGVLEDLEAVCESMRNRPEKWDDAAVYTAAPLVGQLYDEMEEVEHPDPDFVECECGHDRHFHRGKEKEHGCTFSNCGCREFKEAA